MQCTICHMLKMKEFTHLLDCRRLLQAVSCHHQSFPFVPPSAISTSVPPSAISRKRSPNFFANVLVRNPSRRFVKRSTVLFFVSTRLTDLQNVVCFRKIDELRMLLHLDFSTIFILFVYRLPCCNHLRLSSYSARWYVPSSTLNARCPATGIDESAEEDHPYTSPTRKLSASKSSLGQVVCWITHTASVRQCHVRSLRASIKVRDLILQIHLRTLYVRVPIGYDLKLLSNSITHSSSC